MAVARVRRREPISFWPSFVDVLSNLLLVFVFLLSIFALVQFFLTRELSGRNTLLDQLRNQIAELNNTLAMERASEFELNDNIATLQASLSAAESERDKLRGMVDSQNAAADAAGGQVAALTDQLDQQTEANRRALTQVELLNQQLAALRRQIAALEAALNASESKDQESQTRIADLGRRLNVALAERVQELSQYRSDFFGRLREILGNRDDIRIVGDRFVFQSEVLFATGSDELDDQGKAEVQKLADAVKQLETEIPTDIPWVLRVDGHTDKRPITGGRFHDNWDLSSARASSVVRFMVDAGVSPQHLVAAGFGEFQPLEQGDTEEVYAKNRRIELKLTER